MKKIKNNQYKNMLCLLIATLILSISLPLPLYVFADDGDDDYSPGGGGSNNLYVDSDQNVRFVSISQKNFKAGDIVPVAITFEADKFRHVNEFKLTIKSPEDNPGAFVFDTHNEAVEVIHFYEDDVIPDAMIKVSPSLKAGLYPITFEWEYYDVNSRYTGSETVIFSVTGRSDNFLYISNGKFQNDTVNSENKTTLTVEVTNPSEYVYQQVEVYFDTEGSDGFSLYENFKPVILDNILPNETKTATFSIYADSSATTGNHPISLLLNYRSPSWNTLTSEEQIYVELKRAGDSGGGGSEGGTPRIIISNYDIDVEQVQAGKNFALNFGLKNTSTTNAVSNIKVVVSSTTATGSGSSSTSGDVFFPSEGSNSFFIDNIPVGSESTQSIDLMTKQDVEPGVYSVVLKIDYEYGDGQSVSTEEQIAFSVTQEQRLEIQGLKPPTFGQVGATMPVEFQFINKGKAIIYNMSVTVDGDFELEGGDSYVGNLPAGYNDYYDAYLIPTKAGESTGAIVLQFEDSVGNMQETRSEFTVMIDEGFGDMGMNMGDMSMGGDFGMDFGVDMGGIDMNDPYIDSMGGVDPYAQQSNNTGTIVIAVIVIALVSGGVIVLKKNAKKKAQQLEEDEDEED